VVLLLLSFYCKNITEFLNLWHTCSENLLSETLEGENYNYLLNTQSWV